MFKSREPREPVVLPVRIRMDSGWVNATIRNVSTKGMKLEMPAPPPQGSFIEIRRGPVIVVGQVRWIEQGCCGLLAQGRVPVAQLKTGKDGFPHNGVRVSSSGELRHPARVRGRRRFG